MRGEEEIETTHLLQCVSPAWWPSAKRSDPIPSRTRPSNASAPMVLCLKTWESRSSPGLPNTSNPLPVHKHAKRRPSKRRFFFAAGWSSPVARQAHNLKVAGSNPAPASKEILTNPKNKKKPPRNGRQLLNQKHALAARLPGLGGNKACSGMIAGSSQRQKLVAKQC